MQNKTPTISACLIVKDEASTIGKCLRSLTDGMHDYVDEIIFIDTGSTDETLDIVEGILDETEIHKIKWSGSFSDMRNKALSEATSDYIFTIDGDEWFKNPEREWPKIYKALEQRPAAIAIDIYNILPEGQILTSDTFTQTRLFQNHKGIQYKGKIHNQIDESIQEAIPDAKFLHVEARLEHTGYGGDRGILCKKYTRRLPMLLEAIQDYKDQPKLKAYYQYQTGNALFMTRQYSEALYYFNLCNTSEMIAENRYQLSLMSTHCSFINNMYEEALKHSREMTRIWIREPLSMFMRGMAHLELEDYGTAYMLITMSFHWTQHPIIAPKMKLDLEWMALACGDVCMQVGRLGEAKRYYQIHLTKYDDPIVREKEQSIQKREPWMMPNENGELPGDVCCQRATGEYCYEHDPNTYKQEEEDEKGQS